MFKDPKPKKKSRIIHPNPSKSLESDEDEDDDDEDDAVPAEIIASLLSKDNERLENRGIIVVGTEISKLALARATKKLLSLHFDKDFVDDVQIIINSPGGYTDAGWAFVDLMAFVRMPIRTIAMGEICSMATHIFVAGDHRIMAPNSCAMIHQFSWTSGGNYSDLVANRKSEDMEYKKEIRHLINNSKYSTEAEIRKNVLLDKDHWLTPEEMEKHGLCDEVYKPKKQKKTRSRKVAAKKKVAKKRTKRKRK